jgi:hypothetical protein
VGVAPLIDSIGFDGLIADKAFDSNQIVADLNERVGARVVISQHPRRKAPLPLDSEIYKWRHLVENFFCKLKSSNALQCERTKLIKSQRNHSPRCSRHKFSTAP